MKQLVILLIYLFGSSVIGKAQNNEGMLDDHARISLNAYVSEESDFTAATRKMIKNKLQQMITQNGLGGEASDPRFIITSNVVELTKDILGTAPPMHALTLEVSFFIGDGIEGQLFSSMSKTVKGVGTNPTKAQMNALKGIKSKDPEFEAFLEAGKTKILEYYNTQCDFILKEARSQFEQRSFDEAVNTLMRIPQVCKECFEKALDMTKEIQLAKMEYECQTNLNKARASIAKDEWEEAAEHIALYTPDFDCYDEVRALLRDIGNHHCAVFLGKARGAWNARDAQLAGQYLANIPSDSDCSGEANALGRKVASSLDAAARRKWELAYEKYNRDQTLKENKSANDIALANRRQTESERDGSSRRDLADREMKYKEEYGFELEKARIKAARDVGVAYGKNQPKTKVTYNVVGWW
jgi:hypothetical protein